MGQTAEKDRYGSPLYSIYHLKVSIRVRHKITLIRLFSILDRKQEIAEIRPASVTQGKTWGNSEQCCAAAHAIDRDLSTPAATETDNGAGWIQLQFDKTYFINKVVIYYRFYNNWYSSSDGCVQSAQSFRKCVDKDNSVDVSVYQGEAQKKSCGTLQLTYGLEQSDQIYTLLCNTDGDTVKLSKDYGTIVVLEVAITGKCTEYIIVGFIHWFVFKL